MQFKHPEILYVLFALLIPIIIHLFQLQRFRKTPFTNIKFLKEIELQTRKSSRIKKWLVLFTRLALFASLIIAFAQPYYSKNNTSKDWYTLIYLDNSISMQTKGERGELFKRSVQDIAEFLPEKGQFSLLLNDQISKDLSKKELVEKLKNTDYSPEEVNFKKLLLQAHQIFEKQNDKIQKFLLISDFQKKDATSNQFENLVVSDFYSTNKQTFDFVQLSPQKKFNISIDSVYILERNLDNTILNINLSNQGLEDKNISVSALQNQIVLAKKTLDIPANGFQKLDLRIPDNMENVSIKVDVDDAYFFDNTYYISFHQADKINILTISEKESFLQRIYTSDEFNYLEKDPNQIAFELIDKQQLIVLDGLTKISKDLQQKLVSFVKNKGNLVIIPNKENSINDLNSFFNLLQIGQLVKKHQDSLHVTKIHFSHPILNKVFDKNITNFQYPTVTGYFEGTLKNAQSILSFENQSSFISQISKDKGCIYWVASALDNQSSNFTKAPLIVPVFYNIGKQSKLEVQLSYRIGKENKIPVFIKLQQDEVVHVSGKQFDFIPLQEIHAEKVVLITDKQPQRSGFYKIKNKEDVIKSIAYNNPKNESDLSFIKMTDHSNINDNVSHHTSIQKTLSTFASQQSIQSLFKWFVLLAFLFLFIEILLLKYL